MQKIHLIPLFSVLGLILISGCASQTDITTIMLLNERLKALETVQKAATLPVVVTSVPQEESASKEPFTVYWITNSNESVSPIKVIRRGGKYIGPKGEEYTTMPTQRQIERIYRF